MLCYRVSADLSTAAVRPAPPVIASSFRHTLINDASTTVAVQTSACHHAQILYVSPSNSLYCIGATTIGTGGDKSPPTFRLEGTSNVLVPPNFLVIIFINLHETYTPYRNASM